MLNKMKKLVMTAVMAVAFTVALGSNADAATKSVTATTTVNVREGASTSKKIISSMSRGKKATVLGTTGSWIKVRVNGKTGYVHSAYVTYGSITSKTNTSTGAKYSASYFRKMGVIRWNGWRWTWYSQRVLPGKGLKIPGRHVDGNKYVCDKDDYICLASSKLKKGTVVSTPFGKKGKVYDSGCAAGTLDVYVAW